jgi:hypothetical protein
MTKLKTQTPEYGAMKYETRTTSVTVCPVSEPAYSTMATKIEIADEAAGEFVEVSQSSRSDISKISINPEEWPELREAINRMIQECRKNSR